MTYGEQRGPFEAMEFSSLSTKVVLKGRIYKGLGQGAYFTQLDWVREQFKEKLGFDPFPGTLNLRLESEEAIAKLKALKSRLKPIEIVPLESQFCTGLCLKTVVAGKIEAALVFPQVPDYPQDVLEVVAPINIKESIGLDDGEELALTFTLE